MGNLCFLTEVAMHWLREHMRDRVSRAGSMDSDNLLSFPPRASPDISHYSVHRSAESAKVVVRERLSSIRGAPRCRQSVAQICLDLHPWKAARWWLRSTEAQSRRTPGRN